MYIFLYEYLATTLFRSNLLRIIDTKYAIIIKNNEKPKAETNETPPSED